jgi:aldose sugar dehydrogenase
MSGSMKKFRILILIMLQFCLIRIISAQVMVGNTSIDTTTIIAGIDIPWEIIWGSDNHIWMTERYGRISRVNPDNRSQQVLLVLDDCHQQGESGLMGMALHPDFTNHPQVFIAYTYLSGSNIRVKIVRYEYTGSTLVNPVILIGDIPGANIHNGCRLSFKTENGQHYLFITTGDANNTSLPQNTSSLAGKVLRIFTDGSIPADNPFPGNPVWTWGHRNAQGLVLAPNGIMYSSEHGTQANDELNIIEGNRNYGWADMEGFCDTPQDQAFCDANNVREPLTVWTPSIAPSGIAWYGSSSIPEWENSILLAILKDKMLVSVKLNSAGNVYVSESWHFQDMFGRLRDVCVSPDGDVYLATNGSSWHNNNPFTHRIVRVSNPNKTSTGNLIRQNSMNIYPNPAKDRFIIELPEQADFSVVVRDISGKQIASAEGKNVNSLIIETQEFTGGLYFVSVEHSEGVIVKKVLLRH